MTRLIRIDIDDSALPPATPEMEQERRVAIFDLLEDNSFALPGREGMQAPPGPYALHLAVRDGRLVFEIATDGGDPVAEFHLAMGPFRQAVKDYSQICGSYFEAVRKLPTAQIEAIDMGRRGLHNEASETLRQRLEGKVDLDHDTARRLFTLIFALHWKG